MIRYLKLIIVSVLFFSCVSHEQKPDSAAAGSDTINNSKAHSSTADNTNYFKIDGDSLVIPSFDIEVSLSEKANEKLTNDKETVIVAAWFSGQPKDTTSKEYAESGEMFIQSARVELSNSRVAKFGGIKFSKALYDSLAGKDISVLVTIFSGRRSTQDNLLDCAILAEKMSAVKEQKFVLTGKLIAEPDSLAEQ
jgi:hypothetical protein